MRWRDPDAGITAIDVSDTSLRHTDDLRRKYDLKNLEPRKLAIEDVHELGRSFDLVIPPACCITSRTPTAVLAPPRRPASKRRDALDGLCAIRPRRYLHDAGILSPPRYRSVDGGSSRACDARRAAKRPSTLGPAEEVEGFPAPGSNGGCTPKSLKIAPTPSRKYMHGRIGAACHLVAGSNKLPTSRNVGWWQQVRMRRVSGLVARSNATRGCRAFPAERWSPTVSLLTATMVRISTDG